MSDPKTENKIDSTPVIVGNGKHKRRPVNVRLWAKQVGLIVAGIVLFVIIVAVVVVVADKYKAHHQSEQARAAKQAQLLGAVMHPENYTSNPAALKAKSTELINGVKQNTYKLTAKQLAQAYAARGSAELSLRDYAPAAKDYEQAVKTDASMQSTVAYQEFLARYKAGERQTLIPLLQQMADSLKDSHNSFLQSDRANYEQYIQDIKNNQDIEL